MRGYVVRKGDRWYGVVYDGLDPVTGRERRRWHSAGTNPRWSNPDNAENPGNAWVFWW